MYGSKDELVLTDKSEQFELGAYKLPATYDISLSTKDNYKSSVVEFSGEYASIRESLDNSYHGFYQADRQMMQDVILHRVLRLTSKLSCSVPPWLIFTCGSMGAGKGYCMNWMRRNGIIRISDLVCLDADVFRRSLPEWKIYVKNCSGTAGSLTHSESCLMVEIAQEVAMKSGRNVWVDGSLSDTEWALAHIRKIKTDYPKYKIAVVSVVAPEDIILSRCDKRAKSTGRRVPLEKIRKSVTGSTETIKRLSTRDVDLIVVIENAASNPKLLSINKTPVTDPDNWDNVSTFFA